MSNKKPYTTVSNSNKSEEEKEKKGRRKRSDEIANSILSAECCTATTECPLSIVFVTGRGLWFERCRCKERELPRGIVNSWPWLERNVKAFDRSYRHEITRLWRLPIATLLEHERKMNAIPILATSRFIVRTKLEFQLAEFAVCEWVLHQF